MARDVIYHWNADCAFARGQALLPVAVPVSKEEGPDLLVACFCSSQTGVDDPAARETEEKIEKQMEAGRPVLVYFSEARAGFGAGPDRQEPALVRCRERYDTRMPFNSFSDEKEFRARFARDLETLIETHPLFARQKQADATPAPQVAGPEKSPNLSELARTLLSEACEDFEAYIGRVKIGAILRIQANGKQLVENQEPATVAKWEAAFNELLGAGLIRDAGCNGQLFQISAQGFEVLKGMGKTPVGYIAELGSV